MIVTFLRDTSKISYAVCQAAIIGIAIAVNRADEMYGISAPEWLTGVAVFFYTLGLVASLMAKNIEKTREAIQLRKHRGKRHRIKIPKNTTLTIEVEP